MFNQEERKYSIVGKVEIGTDEYRDLIEAVKDSERAKEKANNDYWKEREKALKAEQENKALKEQFNELYEFVNSSEEMKAKFKTYKVEKQLNALQGVNNNE